jgi:ferric-dicitrate binding protein FerR (iron transport regulator)
MKKPYFLTLLSKKLRNEISAGEHEQLQEAINHNESYKELANELSEYFHTKNNPASDVNERLEKTWEMIDRAEVPFRGKYDHDATPASPFRLILKIAAVLVIMLTAGTLSYYALKPTQETNFTTLSATDDKIFMTLEDGTRIWLNLNSSIRYNEGFGTEKRELFLNGEAFFDVVKNDKVPMVIHARNIDITVKGTAFNVNAYKNLPGTEVLLVRGSVEVTHRLDNNRKVLLKPSEKLIVADELNDRTSVFRIMIASAPVQLQELKWTSDSIVFKKEKLKDLAVQLEKKYGVKIDIRNEQLKNMRFSGTFTGETIGEVLEALRLSYPFSYTLNNKQITIDKP